MNLPGSRLCSILALAVAITCVGHSGTSYAQSAGGNAINQSTWNNATIANPPGDGTTNGALLVGVWASGSQILGAPAFTNVAHGPATMPFTPAGASYAYTITIGTNGDYDIVAWIDANADGGYNLGEPRSSVVSKTLTNAMVGINLTVNDDSDGDGLPDWWEAHWFSGRANSLELSGSDDPDNDGMANLLEYQISTAYTNLALLNPANWDTDGDSMDDAWEYDHYANGNGTDPCNADSLLDADGDGLGNLQEYQGVDGYSPKQQDPAKASGIARVNPNDSGDEVNAIDIDTDNDGLIDSFEAAWYDPSGGIDPRTKGDYTADPDLDGLSNYREQCLLAELRQGGVNDIWSSGISSFPPVDAYERRAFTTAIVLGPAANTIQAGLLSMRTNANEWTDPTFGTGYVLDPGGADHGQDTDRDTLPDGWEVEFNLDPKDPLGDEGAYGDPDGDGLLTCEEYLGQDGDRYGAINGTGDETNPNSHNWRPDSTGSGDGCSRPTVGTSYWYAVATGTNGTLGAALPTTSFGFDIGTDTDDDGIDDDVEIQQEYDTGLPGSSPVHSMHPFIRRSALITNDEGIPLPDPEGNPVRGYLPLIHARDWTIECHVKIASTGRSGYLFDCTGDVPGFPDGLISVRLELTNDVPRINFDTIGGKRYAVSGLPIPTNLWTHLAGVWDHSSNSLALYVDGVFVQEQRIYEECVSGRYYPLLEPPRIGWSPQATFSNQVFLDEIRIWGVARTAQAVEDYRTKFVPQDSAGLLAYYRFDDGGTSAEDFARKAKTGLLGASSRDYYFGDFGYALTNNFAFVTNDYANVRGVDTEGADDSDGDGMPDGWEMINHLDPFSADGVDGADGDPDGDGLSNIYEYWSHTSPGASDTDQDAILDAGEDFDGDGAANILEMGLGSRPNAVDTDDDGRSDDEEIANGTSPVNATDPAVPRSLWLAGGTNDYLLVPNSFQQRLTDWTLEAWVHPTNVTSGAGTIIQRIVETPLNGTNAINFVIGLETNVLGLCPYAGYQFKDGTSYFVRGSNIPVAVWTHLAASYDSLNARLRLYTNGVLTAVLTGAFGTPPRNGKGGETALTIGQGFEGQIDEVRIWNDVRSPAEIAANYDITTDGSSLGLIHYFMFDDGQAVTNAEFPTFTTFFQPHGAQDFTVATDWAEEWAHAAMLVGNVQFVLNGAIPVPPSLSVFLEPFAAREAGAQWAFDGGAWRNNGDVVISSEGTHTVTYKSLAGWTAPETEQIVLSNNQARTMTGVYVENASVKVTLEPGAARALGAQWQLDSSVPYSSDEVVLNLAPGQHTIRYSSVGGWIKPADEIITLAEGEDLVLTRQYVIISGRVTVFISPAYAGSNGAWRVNGGAWRPSDSIFSNLSAGSYVIDYRTIPGWSTPASVGFSVSDNDLISLSAQYIPQGTLSITLLPTNAVLAGAQWRLSTSNTWQNSGTTNVLDEGTYTVYYKPLDGWRPPDEADWTNGNFQEVFYVSSGATVAPTRYYTEIQDSDGDSMEDWWERAWFGDLSHTGAEDFDKDGLSNLEEHNIAVNIPALAGMNPISFDTDGDGMNDKWEYDRFANGTGLNACANDAAGDADRDGLFNWFEYIGVDSEPPMEQDPAAASGIARANPQDAGDSLDPLDVDSDGDFLLDGFEYLWHNPGEGINARESGDPTADTDQDGLSNYREQCLLVELHEGGSVDIWSGTNAFPVVDTNGVRRFPVALNLSGVPAWTDPCNWDTDYDLLPDGWEVEFNLDPLDGTGNEGAYGDPDGDNLLNVEEYEGQDGDRAAVRPYVNGTGDETNPNEHNWRPLSTDMVAGTNRVGTIGSALPTASLGTDNGSDSDDDGIADNIEIQQEYESVGIGSSPVHSTHPFVRRSALILNAAGIEIPDPEGAATPGYRPDIHTRDWTLECSVRLNSSGRNGYLIDIPGSPTAPAPQVPFTCRLWLTNDVPMVSFYTVGGYLYTVKGMSIPTNKWTHIAGVWSHVTNSLSLYIDGVFVQEQRIYQEAVSSRPYYLTNPPTIGRSPDGSFVGEVQIDEVRIWNNPRSQDELEQFRTRLVPQNSTNLLSYYRFDDGGTKAEDYSRKAKHGLLGATSQDGFFGDNGYGLSTNIAGTDYFMFRTDSFADVTGVDARGADDTDGDGMPDGWETVNHLNPLSATGADGANGDPDGDLLQNIYEYWAQCNPRAMDSDQNGTFDGNEDRDGDGVVNKTEQDLGSRPDMVDTDDDGTTDNDEQAAQSDPANPTDPSESRAILLGGSPDDYLVVPNSLNQRLTDWTIEAWVNPADTTNGVGYIVRRIVETPATGSTGVNFVVGLEANAGGLRPYAGYQFTNGLAYYVRGSNIPIMAWTHISASYESLSARLTISTNGNPCGAANNAFRAPPINGKGGQTALRFGEDFAGMIDDVRIWSDVRTTNEVRNYYARTVDNNAHKLVHYFRFDDGQAVTNATFPAFTEFFQPHGAQDFTVSSDWNQQWRHAATLHGSAQFTSPGAIQVPPSLKVILYPEDARIAGAQWAFNGGEWRDSAATVIGVPGSTNVVTYKSVDGWTAPASELVVLTNNVTLSRTYLQNSSLRVILGPAAALATEPLWYFDGEGHRSEDVVTDISPGSGHSLSFSYISGWEHLEDESLDIPEGVDMILTRTYTKINGKVRVTIWPTNAVLEGAKWRIGNSMTWNDSGAIVSNLTAGSHTIRFLDVTNWITPQPVNIYVDNSVLIEVPPPAGATEYERMGYVQIFIEDADARMAGAMWRLVGLDSDAIYDASWLTSGLTNTVSPGSYHVEFLPLSGFEPPHWWDAYYGWWYYYDTIEVASGATVVRTNYYEKVEDWDNDGMDDSWEYQWFHDLDESGWGDYDNDGLSNLEEYQISFGTPLSSICPTNFDTDFDGMDDKWEFENYAAGAGANPTNADAAVDSDNDGLPNLLEYLGADGQAPLVQDPGQIAGIAIENDADSDDALMAIDVDTDGDHLLDSFEYYWFNQPGGIDPSEAGKPGEDLDKDGLTNYREQCLLVELREGGANDIWSGGTNDFPVATANGLRGFGAPMDVVTSPAWTDPCDWDTDSDLLPDGWEVEYDLDPRNSAGANGYFGDPDGDTLLNFQEFMGQDGKRSATDQHLNGSGDETNPFEHSWRPDSTGTGPGLSRPELETNYWFEYAVSPSNGTLGAALPTARVGFPGYDTGADTDDDGISDATEIQREFGNGLVGASPVHSMDPFIKRSALIVNNDGIDVPDPEGNPFDGYNPMLHGADWTAECHVKITAAGRSGYLIDCPGPFGAGDIAFRLELSNDIPVVSFDTLGLYRYSVEGLAIPTNKWTHLAAVWNSSANSLSLYIDGVFVIEQRIYEESLSGYLYTSAQPPRLCLSTNGTFANQLYVDEVRIWKIARTPADIDEYRTRLVAQDSAGLQAYFRFDDGGTSAEDFARKAKNGLLGAASENYLFGDFGYALATNRLGTNYFVFVTNEYANVRGVDRRGADDSDGDGLPDPWELINRLDPFSPDGENGSGGDPDGDGLNNSYEFWSDTNPRAQDTDKDGILDNNEDFDGDGVVNGTEQVLGSRPDMVDTDDDGFMDSEEQAASSNPVNPTDPAFPRCMQFGGSSNDYLVVPNALAQRLSSWTLEAWVAPSNAAGGVGTIVRRVVEDTASGKKVNFVLGLQANAGGLRPYAGYQFSNSAPYFVTNTGPGANIPIGAWTHLAASYNSSSARLTLYTNGAEAAVLANAYLAPPINGKGGETFLRIGEDFQGLIDDVRIWSDVRTAAEIAASYDRVVEGSLDGLVHYFRFDDGQAVTNAMFPAFTPMFQPHGPQDFTRTADWNQEWVHAASMHGAVEFSAGGMGMPPTLAVILDPAQVRDIGAQWSFDATEWRDSGEFIVCEEGEHLIIFKSVYGWTTPNPELITLTNNQNVTMTRTYLQNGAVRVELEPDLARMLGAQWQIDGGPWQDSGAMVTNLSPGAHTINFMSVTNYITPPSQSVVVNEGEVTPLVVWYQPILGSVVITIQPQLVVSNGAQWRVDGGAWTDSGTIVSNLTIGAHTVEFLPVLPWTTPDDIIFTVVDESLLSATGRYTQITGLQVLLNPPAATLAGAQWRLDGGDWQNSGTLMALPTGQYTVGFKPIANWVEPNDILVTVSNDMVSLIYATYYDLDIFGSAGAASGQFNKPRGLAIVNRYLYVADSGNNRIQMLDTLTSLWTTIGGAGTGAGQFNQPFGVALDPVGNLWVADAGNHRVQRRDAVTGAWSVFGSKGSGVGQFIEPFDLDADSAGNLYVVDHYNHRIQKRATSGAWSVVIAAGTNNGAVRFPNGIGIDRWDNLYVSDRDPASGVSRIQKFDKNGFFLAKVGSSVSASGGFSQPRGIEAGLSTNIYVADTYNNRVQELIPSGWSVVMDSMFLNQPEDVEIDQYDNLFIADTANNRVLRLAAEDSDGDGLPNWVENNTGVFSSQFSTGTSPTNSDSDLDGYSDWQELRHGTNYPNNALVFPPRTINDYDGDGMADLVVYYPSTGGWRIRQSSDWSVYSGASVYWGWSAATPVQGDYDGDGRTDIAVYWAAGGTWYIRYSGGGSLVQNWGWSEAAPAQGDYDGDGKTDIAVYWAAGGTWYIKYSSGGSTNINWGWSAAVPVPGDYDGDGRTDIAVYWAAGGKWYVRYSGGGSTTISWGWSAAEAVPGDYDGDGRTDMAVYAASTGRWYLRYSTGGSGSTVFGATGWRPVQGDYDGDGRTDIGVYQSSSGTWYIGCTSGGGGAQVWGSSDAMPVPYR